MDEQVAEDEQKRLIERHIEEEKERREREAKDNVSNACVCSDGLFLNKIVLKFYLIPKVLLYNVVWTKA